MKKQITIEEVFELVEFTYDYAHGGGWVVSSVKGDVRGDVYGNVGGDVGVGVGGGVGGGGGVGVGGNVYGHVYGNVYGNVYADVSGSISGDVRGTINGKQWQYVETPRQKVERLIKETGSTELIEAFNQLEDNS